MIQIAQFRVLDKKIAKLNLKVMQHLLLRLNFDEFLSQGDRLGRAWNKDSPLFILTKVTNLEFGNADHSATNSSETKQVSQCYANNPRQVTENDPPNISNSCASFAYDVSNELIRYHYLFELLGLTLPKGNCSRKPRKIYL